MRSPNLNEFSKKHALLRMYIFHKSSVSSIQRDVFKITKVQVLNTQVHNEQSVAL